MNLRVEPGDTDLRLQLSSYLENARLKDVPATLAANQNLGSCIDHDDSVKCRRYVIVGCGLRGCVDEGLDRKRSGAKNGLPPTPAIRDAALAADRCASHATPECSSRSELP